MEKTTFDSKVYYITGHLHAGHLAQANSIEQHILSINSQRSYAEIPVWHVEQSTIKAIVVLNSTQEQDSDEALNQVVQQIIHNNDTQYHYSVQMIKSTDQLNEIVKTFEMDEQIN